jgi:hypothetical protein
MDARRGLHKGGVAKRALDLIKAHGPMTAGEVGSELGVSTQYASARLCELRKLGHARIHSWRRDACDGALRARALYCAGAGRDATKPDPLPKLSSVARHTARRRGLVNSVFGLGVPVYRRRIGKATLGKEAA